MKIHVFYKSWVAKSPTQHPENLLLRRLPPTLDEKLAEGGRRSGEFLISKNVAEPRQFSCFTVQTFFPDVIDPDCLHSSDLFNFMFTSFTCT